MTDKKEVIKTVPLKKQKGKISDEEYFRRVDQIKRDKKRNVYKT